MSYVHLILKAPISKDEAEKIANKVVEEEMFFITMDHLFEDDRKKDREALEKAEKREEKERKKAEKERKKAEKERISKEKAILKFYNRGFSIEELAEDFELEIEEIKRIIEKEGAINKGL